MQAMLCRTRKGNQLCDIDVRSCYKAVSTNLAKTLLAFHTFSGCDQTGRFCENSKTFRQKEFRKADKNTPDVL